MTELELRKLFGVQLKTARWTRGLSQVELANKCGCCAALLSHFEAGRKAPSVYMLVALAVALGVTTDRLLGVSAR